MVSKFLTALVVVVLLATLARAQNVISNQHTTPGTLEGKHQFTGQKMTSTAVTWHTKSPRWLMVFDTQSAPANGIFTDKTPLIVCQFIQGAGDQPDGTQNYDWTSHPVIAQTGLLVMISTNPAACTALTVDGPNDWLAAQMQ